MNKLLLYYLTGHISCLQLINQLFWFLCVLLASMARPTPTIQYCFSLSTLYIY